MRTIYFSNAENLEALSNMIPPPDMIEVTNEEFEDIIHLCKLIGDGYFYHNILIKRPGE